MNLILIGFKSCGKTTVGSRLAKTIPCAFIDTDTLIEQRAEPPMSLRDIYRTQGDVAFRSLEKSVIQTLHPMGPTVIATGGGVVLEQENIAHLRTIGKLVYLYVSCETFLARLSVQPLPAFLDQNSMLSVYDQRKTLYQEAADLEISTEHHSIAEVVKILHTIYHAETEKLYGVE